MLAFGKELVWEVAVEQDTFFACVEPAEEWYAGRQLVHDEHIWPDCRELFREDRYSQYEMYLS